MVFSNSNRTPKKVYRPVAALNPSSYNATKNNFNTRSFCFAVVVAKACRLQYSLNAPTARAHFSSVGRLTTDVRRKSSRFTFTFPGSRCSCAVVRLQRFAREGPREPSLRSAALAEQYDCVRLEHNVAGGGCASAARRCRPRSSRATYSHFALVDPLQGVVELPAVVDQPLIACPISEGLLQTSGPRPTKGIWGKLRLCGSHPQSSADENGCGNKVHRDCRAQAH